MKETQFKTLIKEKIKKFISHNNLSEKQKWLVTNAILMSELLNPDSNVFEYTISKGIYTYKDSKDNLFFVRLSYESTEDPFFIMKTGWFEDNDISKPKYTPSLPPDISIYDGDIRTNTLAKIYRDEIIPLFSNQNLSNKIVIEPISISRYQFAIRMIKKLTPSSYKIIEQSPKKIIIKK